MTLTRATLGTLAKRATKTIEIDGHEVKLQRPTPLEFSQYQMGLMSPDGKPDVTRFADAILMLVARMWIDDYGMRLFADDEVKPSPKSINGYLGAIDLSFYQTLSAECQKFASPEASTALGESVKTPDSDSPAESV